MAVLHDQLAADDRWALPRGHLAEALVVGDLDDVRVAALRTISALRDML